MSSNLGTKMRGKKWILHEVKRMVASAELTLYFHNCTRLFLEVKTQDLVQLCYICSHIFSWDMTQRSLETAGELSCFKYVLCLTCCFGFDNFISYFVIKNVTLCFARLLICLFGFV